MVVTGTFEQVFDLMFGPQQHDSHVARWRHERIMRRYCGQFDAAMAEMMAEARRLAAR